jgi:hypothetical protein
MLLNKFNLVELLKNKILSYLLNKVMKMLLFNMKSVPIVGEVKSYTGKLIWMENFRSKENKSR